MLWQKTPGQKRKCHQADTTHRGTCRIDSCGLSPWLRSVHAFALSFFTFVFGDEGRAGGKDGREGKELASKKPDLPPKMPAKLLGSKRSARTANIETMLPRSEISGSPRS